MPRSLLLLAVAVRVLTFLLAFASANIAQFDASAKLLSNSSLTQSLLRWDVFHFAHIAQAGHAYEHEWAFFLGSPLMMRFSSQLFSLFLQRGNIPLDMLLYCASCVSAIVTLDMPIVLYKLTCLHFGSTKFAYLVALISLLPSSPATLLFAPYTEPLFTYLSYKGLLYCARRQWFMASILFALAGLFRSNAVFLSGFILWGILINPALQRKLPTFCTLCYSILLTAIVFLPFVHHQASAYYAFCTKPSSPSDWCNNVLPLVYTHVQKKYWNNGFLTYWTIQQMPNFIIATPPLVSILTFAVYHVTNSFLPRLRTVLRVDNADATSRTLNVYLHESITPHALHAIFLCATLIFTSHIQIILRLAASMPITYWAAAWLIAEYPKAGKWWVGWSVVWGLISVVLWGAFLPPA